MIAEAIISAEWTQAIVAIATALGGAGFFTWIYKHFSRVTNVTKSIDTLAASVKKQDKKLMMLYKIVKKILNETKPNGGKTIKDRLIRIESDLTKSLDNQALLQRQITMIEDHTDIPVWATDASGVILTANKAYRDLVNLPSEEIIGVSWEATIRSPDYNAIMFEWRRMLQMKKIYRQKFYMYTRDERKVLVVAQAHPLLDNNGYVKQYLGQTLSVENIDDNADIALDKISLADDSNDRQIGNGALTGCITKAEAAG